MSLKIGGLTLAHGLMLAPMAGFSDRSMRVVCHEQGAEYSVTEMVSAKAVVHGDKKTLTLAAVREDEGPVALQLFGSEPDIMAAAAEAMSRAVGTPGCVAPVAIDINMGCPVHKIFGNGEGSALMKNPPLIEKIVGEVKRATPLPVTVKLRLGVDRSAVNATECALAAEEAGADLITLHGRTRVEMYSGEADYEAIANVKKNIHIPVVANGDITDAESAIRALRITGADGIAIGRGAVGNPFVFAEIRAALEGEAYAVPTVAQRIDLSLRQLEISVADKGERVAIPEARKQIAAYIGSFRGAAKIRAEINSALSFAEVRDILLSLKGEFS